MEGTVVSHEAYGVYIDFGDSEAGLAVITMVDDTPPPHPFLPQVGSIVGAVFLGYSKPGRQPRLSLRPSDIALARQGILPDYLKDGWSGLG